MLEIGETYQDYRDNNPESSFVKVYTFNSARKSMTTAVRLPGGGFRIYSKGASEIMLSRCTSAICKDGEIKPFTAADTEKMVKDVIEPMASDGLRTITLAYRDFPANGVPPEKGWKILSYENLVHNNLILITMHMNLPFNIYVTRKEFLLTILIQN